MLNNNRKYLIIFSFLIIACLIIICWLILPMATRIKNNKASLTAEKEKISSLLRQGQNIIENRKNFEKIKNNINLLNIVWLKPGDELKFITDLEKIAKENNLKQTIDFDNTQLKQKGKIKIIPIKIILNGDLLDIMSYINKLETLNYYINFTQIDFEKQAEKLKRYANQSQTEDEATADANTKQKIILNVKLDGLTYWK